MGNTIQLIDAYRFLVDAEVVLDGRLRRSGHLKTHYLLNEYEHTFATFEYTIAGLTTTFSFWEGTNETVEVEGNKMYLVDSNGDEVPVLLYRLQRMELDPVDPFHGSLSS